jgi:triosephosphate isomerase
MRRMIISGNWKMNMERQEALELVESILHGVDGIACTDIVICPPFLYLEHAARSTTGTRVRVGAQNLFYRVRGAFTGEISAPMLKSVGCSYVIIGHSERRSYFHETDMEINQKVRKSLEYGLVPILCIGETLEERKQGRTFEVLNRQLVYGLEGIEEEQIENMIIAYEPVWAIGTGISARGEQAEETHCRVRSILCDFTGKGVSEKVRIIYGGSVTPENADELLSQEDIDGGLIGGASLKAETFCRIVSVAESVASIQSN